MSEDPEIVKARERMARERTTNPDEFRANPVREAMRRFHFDPVLHARAHQAAAIVDAAAPSITTEDGEVLRYQEIDRDALMLAASVALILAEIDPIEGDPA